jgi:hypothetical protein
MDEHAPDDGITPQPPENGQPADKRAPELGPLKPIEILLDAAQLTACFVLIWFALHVAGVAPAIPGSLLKWDPIGDSDPLVVYIVALINVADYILMLFLFSAMPCAARLNRPTTLAKRVKLRWSFASAAWTIVVALYFLIQQGDLTI